MEHPDQSSQTVRYGTRNYTRTVRQVEKIVGSHGYVLVGNVILPYHVTKQVITKVSKGQFSKHWLPA